MTHYIEFPTPIGSLVVTSDGEYVTGVYMESQRHAPVDRSAWMRDDRTQVEPLRVAKLQLDEYFEGKRLHFNVPLRATGSDAQKTVWSALSRIPYGETRSYGDLAREIGNPKASRAVGSANGRNPIPIIVPCHRVIGADGSLTGFGGGVERKEWLLAHEAKVSGRPSKFLRNDLFTDGG